MKRTIFILVIAALLFSACAAKAEIPSLEPERTYVDNAGGASPAPMVVEEMVASEGVTSSDYDGNYRSSDFPVRACCPVTLPRAFP